MCPKPPDADNAYPVGWLGIHGQRREDGDPPAQERPESLIKIQEQAGGNAVIGRQLYLLMLEAGFDDVHVSPRMVYVDGRRPDLADTFTRKTFTAMIEGVRESAIAAGLIETERFDEGVEALYRAAEPDGVFCYTFFKGVARKSYDSFSESQ
jgi:hypothetical protein